MSELGESNIFGTEDKQLKKKKVLGEFNAMSCRICRLHKDGLSAEEIHKELGVAVKDITLVLSALYEDYKNKVHMAVPEFTELARLTIVKHREGYSAKDIAEYTGLEEEEVINIIDQLNDIQ